MFFFFLRVALICCDVRLPLPRPENLVTSSKKISLVTSSAEAVQFISARAAALPRSFPPEDDWPKPGDDKRCKLSLTFRMFWGAKSARPAFFVRHLGGRYPDLGPLIIQLCCRVAFKLKRDCSRLCDVSRVRTLTKSVVKRRAAPPSRDCFATTPVKPTRVVRGHKTRQGRPSDRSPCKVQRSNQIPLNCNGEHNATGGSAAHLRRADQNAIDVFDMAGEGSHNSFEQRGVSLCFWKLFPRKAANWGHELSKSGSGRFRLSCREEFFTGFLACSGAPGERRKARQLQTAATVELIIAPFRIGGFVRRSLIVLENGPQA